MPTKQYVPILKWKQGEYRGLAELADADRERILPLFEAEPRPWDFTKQQWKKSLKQHLEDIVKHVSKSWGDRAALVDLENVDLSVNISSTYPGTFFFDAAHKQGLRAIPVTRLDDPDDYAECVALAAKKVDRACIRVRRKDLFSGGNVATALPARLKALGMPPSKVHLIIDLQEIDDEVLLATVLPSVLNSLPSLAAWRTLTIAGGSMPKSVASVGTDAVGEFPRREWALWRALVGSKELARKPGFGDYGIVSWERPQSGVNPAALPLYANMRYTISDRWYVARGDLINDRKWKVGKGSKQYCALATHIVAHTQFCGPKFSTGDAHIVDCAAGVRTGNPEFWVRAGTNHHVAYVARQVAATPGAP